MDIREMTIDDLAAVYHLGEQLFTSQEYSNLYRTWDEYEVAGLFFSDSEFCLVADSDGELAGFALGTVVSKAGSAWTYGHLLWLGVDLRFQRSGVGDVLFSGFAAKMKEAGARILVIDTQADNENALKFFRKRGFGNAVEHVYLSLNLESAAEERTKARKNRQRITSAARRERCRKRREGASGE